MMRSPAASRLSCVLLLALAVAGCGARRPPPAPEPERETLSAVPSTELESSVVRVADPQGQWRFEARSDQVEVAGPGGPYALTPADCTYEKVGEEPVLIRADRAEVAKTTRRVTLQGSVRITSGALVLEADRVEYDLRTGKVVGSGRTKFTLGPAPSRKEGPRPGIGG